jgi:hypothetical protein
MPGRLPLCYEGSDLLICPGDPVRVKVGKRHVTGIVKTASIKSRRVEVWVARSVVTHYQARRRSYRRAEVKPLPGRPQGSWQDGPPWMTVYQWRQGPCRRAA